MYNHDVYIRIINNFLKNNLCKKGVHITFIKINITLNDSKPFKGTNLSLKKKDLWYTFQIPKHTNFTCHTMYMLKRIFIHKIWSVYLRNDLLTAWMWLFLERWYWNPKSVRVRVSLVFLLASAIGSRWECGCDDQKLKPIQ